MMKEMSRPEFRCAEKRHSLTILLAASALAYSTPAWADEGSAADRASIETLSRLWHEGAPADRLKPVLAEDFVRPMANGQMWGRRQQLDWLRDRPPPPGFTGHIEQSALRLFGDVAVMSGTATIRDGAGQEVDRNVFTDVYVRRQGAWQLVSAQRTQVQPSAR